MAPRPPDPVTFAVSNVLEPLYSGEGVLSSDASGSYLATCLHDEAIVSDLRTGAILARIPGDGETLTATLLTPQATHLICCSRSLMMRTYELTVETEDELMDDEESVENGTAGRKLNGNGNTKTISARLIRSAKPHATPVVSAAIDDTGTLIATGGADGSIKVWDIRGGFVTHTFRGQTSVVSCLKLFQKAVPTNDRPSKAEKRKSTSINGQRSAIDTLDSPATSRLTILLASGAEDGSIKIWDLTRRKAIATLTSHVSVVRAIDYDTNTQTILSASRDRSLIFWDARNWTARNVLPIYETIEAAGFCASGTHVFSGGEMGLTRLWNASTGAEVTSGVEASPGTESILQVISHPGLARLMSVHADQSIVLQSIDMIDENTKPQSIISLPVIQRIAGTHDEVIDMAFLGLKADLLALATNSEALRIVRVSNESSDDANTGSYLGAYVDLLQGHEDIIICLDVDWSGCWLATGAKDNVAKLWRHDPAGGSFHSVATFKGHTESIGAVSLPHNAPPSESRAFQEPFNHPPSFLLTGSQDKTVKRWNLTSSLLTQDEGAAQRAAFTRKAHDKDINAMDVNHTGLLFASASQDRTVKIWSAEDGQTQGILRGHKRGVWSVAFAPKNTAPVSSDSGLASANRGLVLTGSGDQSVKLWSLADYSCLKTFEGHTNSVLKVLWIPSPPEAASAVPARAPPALVASAGGDGLVKVWNLASGECATTLDNHTDRVWALAVRPGVEASTLVSGGGDGVVTFWANTSSSTRAAAAEASVARVEQEQTMLNHMHAGQWREAIVLALQLNHPARLLSLFTTVHTRHPREAGSLSGLGAVDDVLVSLPDEHLVALLRHIRDWNTHARSAPVAQSLLHVLIRGLPAARLARLHRQHRSLRELWDGLRAYTERHYRRMDELLEESYLVDFVVRSMEEGAFVAAPDAQSLGDVGSSNEILPVVVNGKIHQKTKPFGLEAPGSLDVMHVD